MTQPKPIGLLTLLVMLTLFVSACSTSSVVDEGMMDQVGASLNVKNDTAWLKKLRQAQQKEAGQLAQAQKLHTQAQQAFLEERFIEAIAFWQQALNLVPVGATKERVIYLTQLGTSHLAIGFHMAIPVLNEALWLTKSTYGEDSIEYLRVQLLLVECHSLFGSDVKGAIAQFEKWLPKLEMRVGRLDMDVMDRTNGLVNAYDTLKNIPKALALEKDVVARRTEKLGKNHPDTLYARIKLANFMMQSKAEVPAQVLYDETVPMVMALKKTSPVRYGNLLTAMSNFEAKAGRQEKSEALLKESLDILLEYYPSESVVMFPGFIVLAVDELKKGHPKAARGYFVHGLDLLKENLGEESAIYQLVKNDLAEILTKLEGDSNVKGDAL